MADAQIWSDPFGHARLASQCFSGSASTPHDPTGQEESDGVIFIATVNAGVSACALNRTLSAQSAYPQPSTSRKSRPGPAEFRTRRADLSDTATSCVIAHRPAQASHLGAVTAISRVVCEPVRAALTTRARPSSDTAQSDISSRRYHIPLRHFGSRSGRPALLSTSCLLLPESYRRRLTRVRQVQNSPPARGDLPTSRSGRPVLHQPPRLTRIGREDLCPALVYHRDGPSLSLLVYQQRGEYRPGSCLEHGRGP